MIASVAALLALAAQAAAVPTPHAGDDPIVVTGRKLPPKDRLRRLTARMSIATEGQFARFTEPVCADAIGVSPAIGRQIADRIAAVARAARIGVAGPGCHPNVTLLLTENGQATLRALAKDRPRMFANWVPADLRAILKQPGPVHVLTVTEVRERDGGTVMPPQPTDNEGCIAGLPCLRAHSASLFLLPTRQDIDGSLVVIDHAAALGRTTTQIADYAAMRALARTRDAADPGDDTILTLFDAAASPPPILTDFDLAYLTALYRSAATETAAGGIGTIASGISRELAGKRPDREK